MQIKHSVYCSDSGHKETDAGYFLRKKKHKRESLLNLNCVDCSKPITVKESEKDWRKHCLSCWLKAKGVPAKCAKCDLSILVWDRDRHELCKACYIKEIGLKKKCEKCTAVFYTHPNGENKTLCYDCYTKQEGVRKKCVECKSTIFVLKKNLSWKNKCGDCYYRI